MMAMLKPKQVGGRLYRDKRLLNVQWLGWALYNL